MEQRGRERHRWADREVEWAGAHESTGRRTSFNGAGGTGDMAGKAATGSGRAERERARVKLVPKKVNKLNTAQNHKGRVSAPKAMKASLFPSSPRL
jgi:hypothetical protein